MHRILQIDLNNGSYAYRSHSVLSINDCGRALALKLLRENAPISCEYLDHENVIVITPGLLSGMHAPSTGRFTIATKQTKGGIRSINLAGPFANRLASLGIAAVLIQGHSDTPVALIIEDLEVNITKVTELRFKTVSNTIEHLRSQHGNNSAVVGIGPAGEHLMPLAGVFSSYPPGEPQYFVVRGGMGDIFGSKGLKAISISSKNEFSADVSDKNRFMKASRALNAIILNHPVCGKALPSYGSITLMRMLKDGSSFEENTENAQATEDNHAVSKANGQKKINRACSTNCPISCLNRQKTGKASLFNSPFDSEAFAASKNLFGIDDQEFVISLNKQCFELGLDSIEFLFSCAMIFKIFEYQDTIEGLHSLLKEVEGATSFGRIIGSTSKGIFQLFADYKELKPMVTKAATSEESSFLIKLPNRVPGLEQISDLEYLYAYILGAQNIGMCLFTTFAVLDKPEGLELLAQMVSTKIGREFSAFDIINSGYKSLIEERAYDLEGKKAGSLSNIPEFVKVLYRYFGRANNG